MAAIVFGDEDPWVVARWAFESLLSTARRELSGHPDLIEELNAAQAMDRLNFARLSDSDGRLLSQALVGAGRVLQDAESAHDDPLSLSWVEALADLERRLTLAYP